MHSNTYKPFAHHALDMTIGKACVLNNFPTNHILISVKDSDCLFLYDSPIK